MRSWGNESVDAVESTKVAEATRWALGAAGASGLDADEAEVLQDSNRLVVRLRPAEVVARVHDSAHHAASDLELEVARVLSAADAPVAAPDARVEPVSVVDERFVVSFWRFYEPVGPCAIRPPDYARALERLHEAMRDIGGNIEVPRFTDRIGMAQGLIESRDFVPAISDDDRSLPVEVLRDMKDAASRSGVVEQLLHGEPHGDNVLRTADGLLFTDLEAVCRGPVEFDLGDVPEEVAVQYRGVDRELLASCRVLVLAMVATWCWAGYDQHPNLRSAAAELVEEVRVASRR